MLKHRLFAVVWWLVVGVLLGGCGKPSGAKEKYKIGAVFTLTGKASYWSQEVKNGMDLALELSGDTGVVEVIYEDVQFQPALAVNAFKKLAEQDRVSVVVSTFTPISQPLRPLAEKMGVPLLATITSAKDFAVGYHWVFRDHLLAVPMGKAIADYVVKGGAASGVALVVNDDYGRSASLGFKEGLESKGARFLGEETFQQGQTDVRPQVQKLLSRNPDAILVVGRGQSLGAAVKAILEQGYRGKIVSINCFEDPSIFQFLTPDDVEGVAFVSLYLPESQELNQVKKAYKEKYGRDISYPAVYGYTICQYLAQILKEAKGDREKVKEGLARLNFESVRGVLKMDKNHDVQAPMGIYMFKGGNKVLVEGPFF